MVRTPRPSSGTDSLCLRLAGFELYAGRHAASSVLERHTHDRPSLCSVRSGAFTEYYPGKAVACDARTLKITPAGEPHWNRFAGVDTWGMRIDVDPATFGELAPVQRLLHERSFFDAAAFAPLLLPLQRELVQPDDVSTLALEGLLLELLARMARLRDREVGVPGYVRRARELLSDAFRARVSVADVAESVGVPPARLARAFRSAYGLTIAQHVRQLRLEAADRELLTTGASLAEIALRAGFYDQSHFSNAYRREYGTTPAARRRQVVEE